MGKILRTNVFTGEREWVDFDGGRTRYGEAAGIEKTYSTAWTRPEISLAAGCHSSQVAEFNEDYRKAGIIGAYHRPDGALVIESNKARNEVLKLRGMFDRDAAYSQHAGS